MKLHLEPAVFCTPPRDNPRYIGPIKKHFNIKKDGNTHFSVIVKWMWFARQIMPGEEGFSSRPSPLNRRWNSQLWKED